MRINEVINYNMNKKESLMAYIADSILNTFNGSYKPHCFDVKCFGYGVMVLVNLYILKIVDIQ